MYRFKDYLRTDNGTGESSCSNGSSHIIFHVNSVRNDSKDSITNKIHDKDYVTEIRYQQSGMTFDDQVDEYLEFNGDRSTTLNEIFEKIKSYISKYITFDDVEDFDERKRYNNFIFSRNADYFNWVIVAKNDKDYVYTNFMFVLEDTSFANKIISKHTRYEVISRLVMMHGH